MTHEEHEEVQVDKTHSPLGYPEEVGSVAKIFTGVRVALT